MAIAGGQGKLFSVPQSALTSDDWYTPAPLFLALGIEFDLDVCAPPGGVPWIPAGHFYTWEDDGLSLPWHGRVWMNPPFSKPAPWVDRFIEHGCGIALVPVSKSAWWDRLWASRAAIVTLSPFGSDFVRGEGRNQNAVASVIALAAFSGECVEAIARVGTVRRSS